jgi:hypothetical protein
MLNGVHSLTICGCRMITDLTELKGNHKLYISGYNRVTDVASLGDSVIRCL